MGPSDKPIAGEIVLSDNNGKTASAKVTAATLPVIEKKAAHFFSAFARNPSNVFFQFQEPEEEVILLIRKHIITNIPWIIMAVILIVAPLLLITTVIDILPFFHISSLTQFAISLTYYLAVSGYILVNFSLWYFHVGLITNERIIDMNFTNILIKEVSETRIDLIEDVSYTQVGALRTIFNYGDIVIQTAGTKPNIEFDHAPRPGLIAEIVGDLIQQVRDENNP